MPEEITTTEPVVETPAVETTPVVEETPAAPVYDWADESIQQRAAEALQRLETWGDPTSVDKALEIQRALATEDGLTQLFVEAGKALGVGVDKLQGLFAVEAPAAPTAPAVEEEEDPDRILTAAEARAMAQKEFDRLFGERQAQSQQQAEQERAVAAVRGAIDSTLSDLKVDPKNEGVTRAVLALADSHLTSPADQMNPEKVKAAIRKGYAEYQQQVEAAAKAYIESKAAQHEQLPSSIGGSNTAGSEGTPEPKNVAEGIIAARRRLGLIK